MTIPIACNLTDAELQERRRDVLKKVRNAVIETRELEDAYSYQLPASEEWLAELAHLVNLESEQSDWHHPGIDWLSYGFIDSTVRPLGSAFSDWARFHASLYRRLNA